MLTAQLSQLWIWGLVLRQEQSAFPPKSRRLGTKLQDELQADLGVPALSSYEIAFENIINETLSCGERHALTGTRDVPSTLRCRRKFRVPLRNFLSTDQARKRIGFILIKRPRRYICASLGR